MMRKVLIIKLGDTLPELAESKGDFEDWFIQPFIAAGLSTCVSDPRKGGPLPRPADYSGILLTGSHAMVTDSQSWSLETAAWLPSLAKDNVTADSITIFICARINSNTAI